MNWKCHRISRMWSSLKLSNLVLPFSQSKHCLPYGSHRYHACFFQRVSPFNDIISVGSMHSRCGMSIAKMCIIFNHNTTGPSNFLHYQQKFLNRGTTFFARLRLPRRVFPSINRRLEVTMKIIIDSHRNIVYPWNKGKHTAISLPKYFQSRENRTWHTFCIVSDAWLKRHDHLSRKSCYSRSECYFKYRTKKIFEH